MRLPSLQSATRLSKVVPQPTISSEELLQRTGCTRESSNRHWKIAWLLRIYTAEGFSLAHLPMVTTLQSFASLSNSLRSHRFESCGQCYHVTFSFVTVDCIPLGNELSHQTLSPPHPYLEKRGWPVRLAQA